MKVLRGIFYLFLIFIAVLVQKPKHLMQLFSLALVDVLMLCGLFYAAGGVASALGNLLIVSVAISNTLLRRRIGLLIAAIGRAARHQQRRAFRAGAGLD